MAEMCPSPRIAGAVTTAILSICCVTSGLPADSATHTAPSILVHVRDARGAPLASVTLTLRGSDASVLAVGVTDAQGRCRFDSLNAVADDLEAARDGFVPYALHGVSGRGNQLEVVLVRRPDLTEIVDVVASGLGAEAPGASANGRLSGPDMVDLPFAGARDYRLALALLPGVVEDVSGQLHIAGAEPRQTLFLLDGFEVGDPATGTLQMRMAPESLRRLDVQRARYSAEYGGGSAGVVSLETAAGGERLRVAVTDFLPSITRQQGIRLEDWTPRVAWSGPLRHQRAWFSQSVEGDYSRSTAGDTPAAMGTNGALRLTHLAKLQVALAPQNLLTASVLWNYAQSENEDLTRFDPLETTVNRKTTTALLTVRDQIVTPGGTFFDFGLAGQRVLSRDEPRGTAGYVMLPGATSGNFYRWLERRADRLQAVARVTLPTREWHGKHQFRAGWEAKPVSYQERVTRRPISVLGDDGALLRTIEYADGTSVRRTRVETGVFVQDQWSIGERALIELGLRSDWDSLARRVRVAPRVAAAWRVDPAMRLSAGFGVFNDAVPLSILALPAAGRRTDIFFSSHGAPTARVETTFAADPGGLGGPRTLNGSLGLERRLGRGLTASLEYHARRMTDSVTFLPPGAASPPLDTTIAVRPLNDGRRERYDSLEVGLIRTFRDDHSVSASYAWSHARTNAAFNFDLDTALLGAQAPAPLPWDVRHRLLSRGVLPVAPSLDLSYTLEWRSGFPFSLTNQQQALVGRPNSRQLPAYFSLNVHCEHRLRMLGARWALRVGANDVTNRTNAWLVDHNVDSPTFLTKDRTQHRGYVARLRFLGRR
jgi:hypothetical protein